jgi:hypothetical protein
MERPFHNYKNPSFQSTSHRRKNGAARCAIFSGTKNSILRLINQLVFLDPRHH